MRRAVNLQSRQLTQRSEQPIVRLKLGRPRLSRALATGPSPLVYTVHKTRTTAPEKVGKIKALWRKYGMVAIGTYLSVYVTTLFGIYATMKTGLLSNKDKVDKDSWLSSFDPDKMVQKYVRFGESLGLDKYVDLSHINPRTSVFVMAWITTKFTEPLRLAVTVAIVPKVAAVLRRAPK